MGRVFIRNVVAYDISALMEYKDLSPESAAKEVILTKLGGDGGIVVIDKRAHQYGSQHCCYV
jgi:beta-aspartyl-peptidase (threonine type)